MADHYRDEWNARGGEHAKAYGDGYADGRCFEALFAEARGARAGVAAFVGLVEMAKMIGARERAKPLPPLEGVRHCTATSGRYRCNIDHDDDQHGYISRVGRVLHAWTEP